MMCRQIQIQRALLHKSYPIFISYLLISDALVEKIYIYIKQK